MAADAAARYVELALAVADLSERGLNASAKWAAEMLCGLPPEAAEAGALKLSAARAARAADAKAREPPELLLARACFADREYARAAHILAAAAPGGAGDDDVAFRDANGGVAAAAFRSPGVFDASAAAAQSPAAAAPLPAGAGGGYDGGSAAAKALFLRAYSLYLAGEQRREEERAQRAGPLGGPARTPNANLGAVEALLGGVAATAAAAGRAAAAAGTAAGGAGAGGGGALAASDPFCLYLLGLVAIDRGRSAEARALLERSVALFPCHWGAWQVCARRGGWLLSVCMCVKGCG